MVADFVGHDGIDFAILSTVGNGVCVVSVITFEDVTDVPTEIAMPGL